MNEKLCISIKFSLKFIPEGLIDNKLALVQVMLAPNRRQAITWTKADLVHQRIYAARGGDDLTKYDLNANTYLAYGTHHRLHNFSGNKNQLTRFPSE